MSPSFLLHIALFSALPHCGTGKVVAVKYPRACERDCGGYFWPRTINAAMEGKLPWAFPNPPQVESVRSEDCARICGGEAPPVLRKRHRSSLKRHESDAGGAKASRRLRDTFPFPPHDHSSTPLRARHALHRQRLRNRSRRA